MKEPDESLGYLRDHLRHSRENWIWTFICPSISIAIGLGSPGSLNIAPLQHEDLCLLHHRYSILPALTGVRKWYTGIESRDEISWGKRIMGKLIMIVHSPSFPCLRCAVRETESLSCSCEWDMEMIRDGLGCYSNLPFQSPRSGGTGGVNRAQPMPSHLIRAVPPRRSRMRGCGTGKMASER